MHIETVYLFPPNNRSVLRRLSVEVPETIKELETGLSGRRNLESNHGMLFHFKGHRPVIWMKNTFFPLDIAFLDAEGRVLRIDQGVPLSLDRHVGPHDSVYALETRSGVLASLGVTPGWIVSL